MAIGIEPRAPTGQRSADDILDLLSRRFRPEVIQQRKIGGREVSYVPVGAVIERLNRACNSWHFRIVSRQALGVQALDDGSRGSPEGLRICPTVR